MVEPRGPTLDTDKANGDDDAPSFFDDPRKLLQTLGLVVVAIGAIYVLVPKLAGLEDGIAKLGDGRWEWIAAALGFNVLAFASYVALFRGVVGERVVHLEWRESYQITMAGLAATRLLAAGGAGGIALTYWALRKAGMPRGCAACRMVAFLVLLYAVYVLSVIVFGILLRTGALPGGSTLSMTLIPAAIGGVVGLLFVLVALVPGDLQRRLHTSSRGGIVGKVVHRLAGVPARVADGTRMALDFIRHPGRGGSALLGALGFWAANIAILWASFMAFDVSVPFGIIVQGFFVGMVANLAPAPGGVGAVDGGMIGAFAIFGFPLETVIAAVLVYRLIAFWLPVPPGIVAFFQLRRTVEHWEAEGRSAQPDPSPEPAARRAVLHKMK